MKRFMTIFAVAMLLMAPAAMAQNQYGWTISDSIVTPFSNTGAAPTFGVLNLYHWLQCTTTDGVSAAEMDIASPAPGGILAYTVQNGFLNAGGATNLLLAVACNPGPIVAGIILALDTAPGDYCMVPSAANGKNVSVDCTNFLEWSNDTIGYNNSGGPVGCAQPLCQVVSVEEQSWGQIKSLYK